MKNQWFGVTVVTVASSAAPEFGMTRDTPPWFEALNARSDALNQRYGLGDHAANVSEEEE